MKMRVILAATMLASTAAAGVGFFQSKNDNANPIARPSCTLVVTWVPDGSEQVALRYMPVIGTPMAECERTKRLMMSAALTHLLRDP